ncbi:MAG: lipoate--protein ligase family protein [Chloroflexota bacterium]
MAVDEAIQRAHAAGEVPPTLRFYRWHPACLSLGYFQSAEQVDFARLRERGLGFVRRPTGGRAILHDRELTYSVVARENDPRVAGGVVESYRRLSAGLLAGLRRLGAPAETQPSHPGDGRPHSRNAACFDVPSDYELTVGGRKLIGSAQTRQLGTILQHGSLLLEMDCRAIYDLFVFPSEETRARLVADLEQRMVSLREVVGREVAFAEAAAAIREGFAEALAVELVPGELTAAEKALAAELRATRYAANTWNLTRQRRQSRPGPPRAQPVP